jgi:hypothetical protein
MSAQPPPNPGGKRSLGGYSSEFAEDDGSASEGVREALAAAEAGEVETYLTAVTELCMTRLLVPLMSAGDETLHHDPARHAEMSAVLLQIEDGRRAMLAFTGVDALAAWNQRARPVPATLDVVADAAVQSQAGTVLVDFAGPHPLVIEGEFLENLALGRRLLRLPNSNFGWLTPAQPGDNPAAHLSTSVLAARPAGDIPDQKERY